MPTTTSFDRDSRSPTRGWRTAVWLMALLPAGILTAQSPPRESACRRDFDVLVSESASSYAGFPRKQAAAPARLSRLTDSLRIASDAARDASDCRSVLRHWLAFFADGHFSLSPTTPSSEAAATPAPRSPTANTPALHRLDDSTSLLVLPSFGANAKRAIDSVLTADSALLSVARVIIDVRGNRGGGTGSYERLLPWLYTNPILLDHFASRSSAANIEGLETLAARPQLPVDVVRQMRALADSMRAHPGVFVRTAKAGEQYISVPRPLPRTVALIVDDRCVSACELFVLDALASRKVVTFGTSNTGGVVDYGNVRPVMLPSGDFVLSIPMAVSSRLPLRPFDELGIAPQHRLPRETADIIRAVLSRLSELR